MTRMFRFNLILALFALAASGFLDEDPTDKDERLTSRQRSQMRNYQHIYDPYPFDFRGFYWLRK